MSTHQKYDARESISKQFGPDELGRLRENFKKFDRNGDGDIDQSELSSVLELIGEKFDIESSKTLLQTGDADGDGKLSFEEFLKLVLHHKQVLGIDLNSTN